MLILRIRQCEVAIAAGRLDEAFGLVQAYAIANHRRGQRTISGLVAKLIERGSEHLAATRFTEALADCDKASKLGGNQPDVIALRTAALDGLHARQRDERGQARVVAEARRHLDHGQLSAGAGLLDAVAAADVTAVAGLKHEIDNKRSLAAATVKAGRRAVESQDWLAAVERVVECRAADPNDSAVLDFAADVIAQLQQQVSTALTEGQLDKAAELVTRLARADAGGMRTRELANLVEQLREGWRWVMQGNYGEARIIIARIAPALPKAAWIKRVMDQLVKAEEAIGELRTGPLGWVENVVVSKQEDSNAPKPTRRPPQPASHTLPSSLMLQVDAVGSFLVLRRSLVTVGAVSSSSPCDVAFVAEPNLPAVTIERIDDDYFLRTRAGAGKLLASGEKLELSPRCRMVFRLPSPASTSAVLDLTGARLPRSDVRRVILMDHDLVIGPGASAHVNVEQLAAPIVLYIRNGQLFARTRQAAGAGADAGEPITLGAQHNIGGVSFVVTPTSSDR